MLDIWPSDRALPVRVVFSGNNIESIKEFDVSSQRSEKFIDRFTLVPANEQSGAGLSDYLPKKPLFLKTSRKPGPPLEELNAFKRVPAEGIASARIIQVSGFSEAILNFFPRNWKNTRKTVTER